MDNRSYIAPSNVPSSNGLITRDEAIALGVFCLKHEQVHESWGHTAVCVSCKGDVLAEGEFTKLEQRFEQLIRNHCSEWVIELLDGHVNSDAKYWWLVDILLTICVLRDAKPDQVLDDFTNYDIGFIEGNFSGPL